MGQEGRELARPPANLVERLLRRLLGDDIFISYSRADGAAYATGLANELAKRNFSCRFDQWGSEPGAQMPKQLMLALRRSAMVVLVGTERAAGSTNVAEEISEFKKTGRRIVPIVFDGVRLANGISVRDGKLKPDDAASAPDATDHSAEALWAQDIQGLPIFCEDAASFKAGNPSDAAVDRIEKTATFWRKDQRLRAATRVTSVVLLILLAASVVAAVLAGRSAERARSATQEAATASDKAVKATQEAATASDKAAKASQEAATASDKALKASQEAERQFGISLGRQAEGDADALRRQSAQKDVGWAAALQHSALLSIESSRRMTKNGLPPGEADLSLRAVLDRLPRLLGHFVLDERPHRAVLTRDGAHFVAYKGSTTQVWKSTDGKLVADLGSDIELNVDRSLAALGRGGKLAVLELPQGNPVWEKPTAEKIGLLRFSGDGRYLATTISSPAKDARQSNVVVWQTRSGITAATIPYSGGVRGIALSHAGDLLALSLDQSSGGRRKLLTRNIVQIWSLKDRTPNLQVQTVIPVKLNAEGQRSLGYESLSALTFSSDAKFLAASTNYHATILDVKTLKEIAAIGGPNRDPEDARGNNVESIAWLGFSADSKTLGTVGDDGTMHTWAVPSGDEVSDESTPGNPQNGGCAVIEDEGGARIVDVSTGENVARVLGDKLPGYCDYASDGRRLLLYDDKGGVWLYDTGSGQEDGRLSRKGTEHFWAQKLSPNGRYVAMVDDKKVVLWDSIETRALASVEIQNELHGHIALAPNGTRFATVSWDGRVHVWETANLQSKWIVPGLPVKRKDEDDEEGGERWNVKSVSFSPTGRFLTLVLEDDVAGIGTYVWDVVDRRELLRTSLSEYERPRFSKDEKAVLVMRKDDLQIIDTATGKPAIDVATGKPFVPLLMDRERPSYAFDPNARRIARYLNGTIIVTSVNDSRPSYPVPPVVENTEYEFSPRGTKLLAMSGKTGWVIDAATGTMISSLAMQRNAREFRFSDTERYLATIASAPKGELAEAVIWDLANNRRLLLPPTPSFSDIAFSIDEKYVVVAGYDSGRAMVFALDSGKREVELAIERQNNEASFSSNRRKLPVPELRDSNVLFSEDGKTLFHWAEDTVSVWEVGRWIETSRLSHGDTVHSVLSVPDKSRLATVSKDGIARKWVLSSAELRDRACQRLTRNLTLSEWRRNFGSEAYAKTCDNLPAPEMAAVADPGPADAHWEQISKPSK